MQEQGAATQEIASNVLHAARGTQEVSDNISGVGEAARKTGETATRVHAAADELSRSGDGLKLPVNDFLRTGKQNRPEPEACGRQRGQQHDAKNNFHRMALPTMWSRSTFPNV